MNESNNNQAYNQVYFALYLKLLSLSFKLDFKTLKNLVAEDRKCDRCICLEISARKFCKSMYQATNWKIGIKLWDSVKFSSAVVFYDKWNNPLVNKQKKMFGKPFSRSAMQSIVLHKTPFSLVYVILLRCVCICYTGCRIPPLLLLMVVVLYYTWKERMKG